MDTKLLKQKILDLAIRGKLVPQDPNDEPASVLLEKIKKEKQELIRQGKIKKDKNESTIFVGDDKQHYEKFTDGTVKNIKNEIQQIQLPDNWRWERFGNICDIARGGSPRPIEDFLTTSDIDSYNWIKIGDTELGGKYIQSAKQKIKSEGLSHTRYVEVGDFLLSNSMSFGRPYILKINGCIHDGWLVIHDLYKIFNQDYLYYLLSSSYMYNQMSILAKGSTVKNLKTDTVKLLLIPIPPLKEQQRIVHKIEELFAQVDKIEEEKQELLKLIDKAKEKVLDLAMKGKLVKQDPNDEPASVLLEKIFEEKKKLAKEGKIKLSKDELLPPQISDDNDYYQNLPATWTLCQLCDISLIINGDRSNNYPSKSKLLNYGNIPFVSALNIQHEQLSLKEMKYLTQEQYDKLYSGKIQKKDILYCIRGSLGKCCLFDKTQGAIASSLVIVRGIKVCPEYIIKILNTKFIKEQITKYNNGTAQPNLAAKDFKKFLIPLPPLNEQEHIVKKIEILLKKLNQIKDSL